MTSTKLQKSYRLDADVVKDIDAILIDHYRQVLKEKMGINMSVSSGTVIELLVREKVNELKGSENA